MKSPSEIVSEEEVERALTYLRDSAKEIRRLTEQARKAEHMLKHRKALLMMSFTGSAAHREMEAVADTTYFASLISEAKAAGALAEAKALREAAAMRIEVWRTQSSNWRSMKL
jgi:hypothetical protein